MREYKKAKRHLTSRTRRLQAVRIWLGGLWEPFQGPERCVEGFGRATFWLSFQDVAWVGCGWGGGAVAGLLAHPGGIFQTTRW